MVIIRGFRAVDDPEASERFILGHRRVLEAHGVKKVTSSRNEWAQNPNVFVVNVESEDGEKVYGGARIHVADGIHPLPIEEATGYMDSRIYERVHELRSEGTGELCGLWNSMEVAGMGIGSFFATRAATVLTRQIGIQSLWGLCAPFTVRWAERLGSRVQKDIGNEGTFYYPKLDLIATVVLLEDAEALTYCKPYERIRVQELRENLQQNAVEAPPGRKQEVEVHYELRIPHSHPDEFRFPNLGARVPYPMELKQEERLPEF